MGEVVEMGEGVTADGRFSYLAAGAPDGLPVVLLHGVGGGARMWTRQLGSLGGRYRVVAWDMPGYGASVPIEPASIGRYGDALADFLRALAIERPVLVGHSIGGMIAQSFIADELGPVRGLVLAQTSAAFGGRDPAWAKHFIEMRLGPLDRGETMATLAPASVAALVGDDPDPTGIPVAVACTAAVPEATWRASVTALLGFDRREALSRIAVPTLLIAGSKDTNTPAPGMAKMAERIAGAEFVCLEGVGHLAMLERPQAFDAALTAFLDGRVPAT